jgi:hypothetical protein
MLTTRYVDSQAGMNYYPAALLANFLYASVGFRTHPRYELAGTCGAGNAGTTGFAGSGSARLCGGMASRDSPHKPNRIFRPPLHLPAFTDPDFGISRAVQGHLDGLAEHDFDEVALRQWSGISLSHRCRTRATSRVNPALLAQQTASSCVLKFWDVAGLVFDDERIDGASFRAALGARLDIDVRH